MRLLVAVLIGLATFSFCEIMAMLSGLALPREQVRLFSEFYVPDAELGFRLVPNLSDYEVSWLNGQLRQRYSTDHLGFRNVGRDYLSAQYFVIGDSFVFGGWVDREKSFYGLMEEYLGCPVITLGVSGYELIQYSVLLENYVPKNELQKKVLLFIFANDLKLATSRADLPHYFQQSGFHLYTNDTPWTTRISKYRTLSFRLYVELESWLRAERRETANGLALYWHRGASWTYLKDKHYVDIEKQLSNFVDEARSRRNLELTVLLIPSKESTYKEHYQRLFDNDYLSNEEQGFERMEGLLRWKGIGVHNLTTLFRANSEHALFLSEDPHWSAAGHALVADFLQSQAVMN